MVLGTGVDLANGSWTALMVKSRPQREMVATIFFSGLFIFGLFLIHEFFSDFFMGFSFYFSTFVINSNFLSFFFFLNVHGFVRRETFIFC
jgi:hypothetical protein